VKKNLSKYIGVGEKAALATAASNGIDNHTGIIALGNIRESFEQCVAKVDQLSSLDEVKVTPVRSMLRRRLQAKRASIAESKMMVRIFSIHCTAPHFVLAAIQSPAQFC
jgi:hypothetical protein